MAYRDSEMSPEEFLVWVLGVKHGEMWNMRMVPAITFVTGCKGYVVTGKKRRREMVSDVDASQGARTGQQA